jgi:hypothetical protein
MTFLNKISRIVIKRIDEFVIKYFTVERGKNKRKWIWKTKDFREATQIYLPRCLFVAFVVIMSWKIQDRVKYLKKGSMYYEAKSKREERVEEESKEIEHYLSIPNEFDPDKAKPGMSVEYKDIENYEFQDLPDDQIQKLEEFEDWIKDLKKN